MYDILAGALVIKLFADTSLFAIAVGFVVGVVVVSKNPTAGLIIQTGINRGVNYLREVLDRCQVANRPLETTLLS